ncbi:hypothetical protein C2S53_016127 [Perilla frutescens var. hirtella]|uniref:DC1 domain-containing protein n=1 Tax=Perilla frutescens var. hirtella TaxID=608512 RepID=A0AAD4J4V0_PERFH|nr:hypothetical protein C2S53_016127 [Perilla frutescens var. hirtella]
MAMVMNMIISHDEREAEKQQININHFSHRHQLEASEIHEEEKGVCSGCEHDIVGPAYLCSKPSCTFLLHDLCFDLPRRIRHHCHANHPLHLLSSPPYSDGEFTCDACRRSGHGFTYHCDTCKFDLHVECASLPEIENRKDHEHPLILMDGQDFVCYVCNEESVGKDCWMYCCLACRCGLHLGCAEK